MYTSFLKDHIINALKRIAIFLAVFLVCVNIMYIIFPETAPKTITKEELKVKCTDLANLKAAQHDLTNNYINNMLRLNALQRIFDETYDECMSVSFLAK